MCRLESVGFVVDSFVCRELNDGLSSGVVDSEGQPLLHAILSQNPSIFNNSQYPRSQNRGYFGIYFAWSSMLFAVYDLSFSL